MNDQEKQVFELMKDIQNKYAESNKMKDNIIRLLIILMFLEAVIGYSGFVWYESQFDYAVEETTTTDNSRSIDISSEGDNAEANYVNGNQYNDDSTHNEEVEKTGGGK